MNARHVVKLGGWSVSLFGLLLAGCSVDDRRFGSSNVVDSGAVPLQPAPDAIVPSGDSGGGGGASQPDASSNDAGSEPTPSECALAGNCFCETDPETCNLPLCSDDAGNCGPTCPGCTIDGECIAVGAARADNLCQVCDPDRSSEAWSNADGVSCDDETFCTTDDVCSDGACTGTTLECEDGVGCNGVSACDEEANRCTPAENQCGANAICNVALRECASTCSGCLIDGVCLQQGSEQPGNPCFVCDTARSRDAYSAAVGKSCGAGPSVCSQQDTCDASGVCQPNHARADTPCGNSSSSTCDAPDACDGNGSCEPRRASNGTACSDDLFCTVGDACLGGSCVAAGDRNCGPLQVCNEPSDRCDCPGCLVGNTCVASGSTNPTNGCQICDPARSRSAYSANTGATCGSAATECSGQDTCNAQSQCAPNHLSSTTRCGTQPASCATPDLCNGSGTCQSRAAQRVEACDNVDNDCDGSNNEGFNLTTDALNCGSCGHSCLGAPCNAGVCQLRVLADIGVRQFQLKVVGDTIYTSDAGSFNRQIHRVRRDGSNLQLNVGLGLGGLRSFDEDGAFFYIWRNFSAEIFLTKCDFATQGANCANGLADIQNPMTLDRTTSGSSVAVDRAGHRVFWYNFEDNATYASPTGNFSATRLVGNLVNGEFIFASNALWGQDASDATGILRVPANGDFPNVVAVEAGAFGFVANSTRLYWISGTHLSFITMPFGNGAAPPNTFAGPVSPLVVAADDTNVYWVERVATGSIVRRCPVGGCPAGGPVTVTAPIIEANGLAVDDRAIYIASGTATRVDGQQTEGGVLLVAK